MLQYFNRCHESCVRPQIILHGSPMRAILMKAASCNMSEFLQIVLVMYLEGKPNTAYKMLHGFKFLASISIHERCFIEILGVYKSGFSHYSK